MKKYLMIFLILIFSVSMLTIGIGCKEPEVVVETVTETVVETVEVEVEVEAETDEKVVIKYAHMNSPESIAGKQANYFADIVNESDANIFVSVYPSSQLGGLQELAEMLSNGTVEMSHNTMAMIGTQYPDYGVLDTPFLYKDVDHLMRVTNVDSALMKSLNEGGIAEKSMRNLYTFYFGSRNLTCNDPIYTPDDLAGKKIRAIPAPIYMAAVEGMGAIATPIDWSEVPTALATGQADGQENPVEIILTHELFDYQDYCMLTNHIMAAQWVGINEDVWQSCSANQQAVIADAAAKASVYATDLTRSGEETAIQGLIDAGMTIIGPDDGLDVEAFRTKVMALVHERFDEEWGDLYDIISEIE